MIRTLPGRAALVLLALAVLAGCSARRERRSMSVPVTVATAQQRDVPYEVDATGTVEAEQSAQVTAQVGGPIVRISFREGDDVRAGKALFLIDPRPFQAAAARAAAQLARSRAQAQAARLELQRGLELARDRMISESDLDARRSNADATAAAARADSAALVTARLDLRNATVTAPISGRTGAALVHVGDLARANATPLVVINQIDPIRVSFAVPQGDVAGLQTRRPADVLVRVAPAGEDSMRLDGRLSFVDNQVDVASGTLLLKAELPNRDATLWPGQFVRVRLRLAQQANAIVVPTAAVTNSQQGTTCFVVQADTTVESRPVKVARNWGPWAVIAEGVRPGEVVVTDGQLRLSPGAKAAIRPAAGAMAGASGGREGRGGRRSGTSR